MSAVQDDLTTASRAVEQATESLLVAATLDHLPRAIREQVVGTLVTTATVAGLLEALSERFVTAQGTQRQGGAHHG